MKRISHKHHPRMQTRQPQWVPFDIKLFPDIISFGHVRGFAKAFLTIELILVTFVVIGSLVLAIFKVFS